MTEEHKQAHIKNVVAFIRDKRPDLASVPDAQLPIQDYWDRWTTPAPNGVTPKELSDRVKMQRAMDAEQSQLRQLAEQRRWDSLTPDQQFEEESLLAAKQLVQLSEAKLAKARSLRQHAAIERYELELEQRTEKLLETKERLEAVNQTVQAVETLKSDPDYTYAVTSARLNLDTMPRGSEDYTKNQVYIGMLERATPANYRDVVREFHRFESDYYARLSVERSADGAAKLAEIDPAMREANANNIASAEASLKSAESLRRAEAAGGEHGKT